MESTERVEFRDGERWVPGYLLHLFDYAGLEPHTMTYEEAVKAANQGMLKRVADNAQQSAIRGHFRR